MSPATTSGPDATQLSNEDIIELGMLAISAPKPMGSSSSGS